MIEWLGIPLAMVGAAMIPKKKTIDKEKIEKIFANRKFGVKKGDDMQLPKLLNKEHFPKSISKGQKPLYTTYTYSLPYGITTKSDAYKMMLPALKDGLGKEVEFDFDKKLKIHVYEEDLPTKWDYGHELIRGNTWEVPVGKNHQGILYHDFDKYQHLLMGGVTQFGKTVCLKGIFTSLIFNQPDNVEFYILDLKGGLEFYKYLSFSQVKRVACDVFQAAEVLEEIIKELKKTEQEFRESGVTNVKDTTNKKRRFIIVDEGAELSPDIIAGHGKKFAQFCQAALSEISRIGGGLGFRLIYCTQYPTKQAVPMQVKMNIVARISFIAAAQVGSMVILDEPGAEELPSVPGRAIYRIEKMRTIQVPYIDDKIIKKLTEDRKDDIINKSTDRRDVGNGGPPGDRKNQTPTKNPRP